MALSSAYNPKGQQFTDLSTIPLAAVERIEVLKGGASAIYGTDAVAGVINIITRKTFDGARIELNWPDHEQIGSTRRHSERRVGRDPASAVACFLAGSYFRRTELVADQRDWTGNGYISQQGFSG